MKVLFVSSGNSQSGISILVKNQGESLKNKKIEVDFFIIKGKGLKGYFKNISILRDHLSNNRYDIIHAHYGLCGIVSHAARRNEMLVVSFMGDDLLGSNKKNGTYTLASRFLVVINKFFAKRLYDFNIVKSDQMGKILGLPDRVAVIPNGVNMQQFYPINSKASRDALGIDNNKKIILFVANIAREEKNYALAKSAFNKMNLSNAELKVVCNVTQRVLNLYYNASNLLVFTSYHEGSPNVIKEAMACNCPIVSTHVGDVENVLGKTNGCYLTAYDAKEVSEKMQKAILGGKRTNGRENIQHLREEIIAEKIINIYRELLG